MGKKIAMKQDQMNQLASGMNQVSQKAGDASSAAGSSFDGLDTFFGSGAGEIANQLGSLQTSLSNVQGIVQRQGDEMFNMDTALASVADAIEVPMDFVKNDQSRFTQYNNEILEKLDGKSVNDGSQANVDDTIAGSGIGSQKQMGDITSSTEAKEEVYDESSVIGKEKEMANVNKAGGEEEEKYDERSGINAAEALANITTGGGTEEKEYDSSSLINQQQAMANIGNGGGQERQDINTQSVVDGQETLASMNKTAELTQAELRDRSRMNAQTALESLSGGQSGLEGKNLNNAAGALSGLEGLKADFAKGEAGTSLENAKAQVSDRAARVMDVPVVPGAIPTAEKTMAINNAEDALDKLTNM